MPDAVLDAIYTQIYINKTRAIIPVSCVRKQRPTQLAWRWVSDLDSDLSDSNAHALLTHCTLPCIQNMFLYLDPDFWDTIQLTTEVSKAGPGSKENVSRSRTPLARIPSIQHLRNEVCFPQHQIVSLWLRENVFEESQKILGNKNIFPPY